MKLRDYFVQLAKTAFGPWLTNYKSLFTEKNLDDDILFAQQKLEETDKNYKIVITSNNVCKILETENSPATTIKTISPHVIGQVFTGITNTQMQKFSEFILHLPEDLHNYTNYFEQEKSKDGYSKIEAFKKIPDVDRLVEKFFESSNNIHRENYTVIAQEVYHLQKFISSSDSAELVASLGETTTDSSDCFG